MTKEECEIETSEAIMEMRRRIAELEKENVELDCQMNRNKYCYSCVNATDRCFRNEVGCPCEKYKSYKDENAERYKPKWHDLQKDPNDVPNDNRYVWTNVGAGYHDDDGWWDDFGRLQGIIAWCEPKFEKE